MVSAAKPVVCIVTPGTRDANNGNWRTAARWAQLLRDRFRIIVQTHWDGTPVDALIALHARRSADSIAAFRERMGRPSLAVVLTGTDLYRDLPASAEAARSLDAADRIIVLQDDAPRLLRPQWRRKTTVVFQSANPLATRRKAALPLKCVVVGHLRAEKDPETLFRALERIPPQIPLRVRHIGAPLDEELARGARDLAARDPRYRYEGAMARGLTRSAIGAAHVLVHPSIVEGGANVIVEAVTAGTPVIASRISGNIGMLGRGYPGYFEARDAAGLAKRLIQLAKDRAYLRALAAACDRRRPLFAPEAERRALQAVIRSLLVQGRR